MSDVNDFGSDDWPLAYACTDCCVLFGSNTPRNGPRVCADCATREAPLERIRRCLGCSGVISGFVQGRPLCDGCEGKVMARRESVLRGVDVRAAEAYGKWMEAQHGRDDDAA